jgi:hypothetical protein
VDAADLERQARTLSGCIPPHLVARLLELGHEQEVQSQAGQGEWFCARAWAHLLGERGRQDGAQEVLAPYVATGWWPAAEFQAELLEGWGRAPEAIALTRPYAQAGDRMALDFVGRLLARHDRGAEAFELLQSGVEDWFLATALVDGFVHEIGQQMSTTLGGAGVWRCSIARRLEEVGRGALREILEDRAQPRAVHGW